MVPLLSHDTIAGDLFGLYKQVWIGNVFDNNSMLDIHDGLAFSAFDSYKTFPPLSEIKVAIIRALSWK